MHFAVRRDETFRLFILLRLTSSIHQIELDIKCGDEETRVFINTKTLVSHFTRAQLSAVF